MSDLFLVQAISNTSGDPLVKVVEATDHRAAIKLFTEYVQKDLDDYPTDPQWSLLSTEAADRLIEPDHLDTTVIIADLISELIQVGPLEISSFYADLKQESGYGFGDYREFVAGELSRACDACYEYVDQNSDYDEPFDLEFAPDFIQYFSEYFDTDDYKGAETKIDTDVLRMIRERMLADYKGTEL